MHRRRFMLFGLFALILALFTVPMLAQDDEAPPTDAIPVEYQTLVTGVLTEETPREVYTFDAEAATIITINLLSPPTGEEFDTYLVLLDAEGEQIAFDDDGGNGRNSRLANFEIPTNGTYYVVVSSFAFEEAGEIRTGDYELLVAIDQNVPDDPEVVEPAQAAVEPITDGEEVTGDLTADDPMQEYSFSVAARDLVTVTVDSAVFDPMLSIIDTADGRVEVSVTGEDGSANINDLVIFNEGDYLIRVESADETIGAYALTLAITPAPPVVEDDTEVTEETPDEAGDMLAYGESVDGELTEDMPERAFIFNAGEGDIVTISLTSESFDPVLALLDSEGREIDADDDSGTETDALIDNLTIPAAGDYTIVASAFTDESELNVSTTGPFTLALSGMISEPIEFAAPGIQTIAYGEAVEGELTLSTPLNLYSFEAAAGDVVTIDATSETFDTYLILRDVIGEPLTADDDGGEATNARINAYELPNAGTYIIVVESYDNVVEETPAAGAYTLTLRSQDAAPAVVEGENTISYGGTVEGEVTEAQPERSYTFSGSAGDVVTIELVGDEGFDAYLLLQNTDGETLEFNDDASADVRDSLIEDYELPEDGEYIIVASSYDNVRLDNPRAGAFTLSLSSDDAPAVVTEPEATPEPETTTEAPADVTIVAIGDSLQDDLTEDEPTDEYTFSAEAGDVVTIDMMGESALDTYLIVENAEGEQIAIDDDSGEATDARIEALAIESAGDYTIIATSYGFVQLDSPRSGSYTLSLSRADAVVTEPEPTEEPDDMPLAGNVLDYGDTITGELTEAMPEQSYVFDAEAGDVVTIDITSETLDTFLILLNAEEEQLAFNDDGPGTTNSTIQSFAVPTAGEYTIVASSYDNVRLSNPTAGTFTLSLQLADSVVLEPEATEEPEATPEAPVTDAGTINYGETVEGDLTEDAPNAAYTFSGEAGENVTITLDADFDSYLVLRSADGEELTFDDDTGENFDARIESFALPTTEDYTIVVDSYQNARLGVPQAGSFALTLERAEAVVVEPGATEEATEEPTEAPEVTPEPPRDDADVLTFGEPVEGELTEADPAQPYTLAGAAGDVVTISLTATFDSYLQLLDPDGNEIAADDDSGEGLNALIEGFTLPADGDYTIVATSFGNIEGTAPRSGEFTLLATVGDEVVEQPETAPETGVLAYGDVVEGQLTEDTPFDQYTFQGSAGDVVAITLISDNFDPYLFLLDGNDTVLSEDDDSAGSLNSRIGPYVIPADGTYTIEAGSFSFVTGGDGGTGAYTLQLETVAVMPLAYDESASGTTDDENTIFIYELEAQSGDLISVTLDADSSEVYMQLNTGDGQLVQETFGGLTSLGPVTLPEADSYLLTVSSFDPAQTAAFTVTLTQVEPAPLAFGEEVVGSVGETGVDVYIFEGEVNEVITVEAEGSDGLDTQLEITSPDGTVIAFDDDGGDGYDSEIYQLLLPETGEYTLTVRPAIAGDTGQYILLLIKNAIPSLDNGTQTLRVSDKQPEGIAVFEAIAGEEVIIGARVLNGVMNSPFLTVTQNGSVIASNNIGMVDRLLIEFTAPDDGQVEVFVEDFDFNPVIIELSLEELAD